MEIIVLRQLENENTTKCYQSITILKVPKLVHFYFGRVILMFLLLSIPLDTYVHLCCNGLCKTIMIILNPMDFRTIYFLFVSFILTWQSNIIPSRLQDESNSTKLLWRNRNNYDLIAFLDTTVGIFTK